MRPLCLYLRQPCRSHGLWFHGLLWLLLLYGTWGVSAASTFTLGSADGSCDRGLQGMLVTGDARLVPALSALRPPQGTQALLLTTRPGHRRYGGRRQRQHRAH